MKTTEIKRLSSDVERLMQIIQHLQPTANDKASSSNEAAPLKFFSS